MSEQLYRQLFHTPSNPLLYARERFGLPRPIIPVIHSLNVPTQSKDRDHKICRKLHHEYMEKMFKFHLSLKDNASQKYWLFWKYDDTQEIMWFYLDFDRHYPEYDVSANEISEIDKIFRNNVLHFMEISRKLKIAPLWVTSPGTSLSTSTNRQQHKYGLHAYIFLDKPIKIRYLRSMLNDFVKTHSLYGIEHSWSSTHRAIRLPGQRHVELCNVAFDLYNMDVHIDVANPANVSGRVMSENYRRFLTFSDQLDMSIRCKI